MKNTDLAYLFWCLSLFGFAGIHRFYLNKPFSGLIWFLTFGLFGIGQIIDLFLIPSMVEEQNWRYEKLHGFIPIVDFSAADRNSIDMSQWESLAKAN